jgi:hypothetical protein
MFITTYLNGVHYNPHMSAHAQLEGHYDFNRVPMSPSGTRVIDHDKAKQCTTWDTHGQDDWYIGPAPEHYRCYTVHINKTHAV